MRFRPVFVVFTLVSLALIAQAEDKPVIRPLNLKDVKLKPQGEFPTPDIIESADELAKVKVFGDDASRDAVKKQIDFTKEKLVVTAWSGPSDTKLTAELGKDSKEKGLVVVLLTDVGIKKDVKEQSFAVIVPKDAKIKTAFR